MYSMYGIQLNCFERDILQDARLDYGSVERVGEFAHFLFERGAHEVVAVVDDECQPRVLLLVDAARELRRNDDGAVDLAVAHVFHRLAVVVVIDRFEGANVGLDGVEGLANLERHGAVVLINYAELGVADFPAEGVAEHDQLDERKHRRHQHQRRGAQELAQFTFDNGPHSHGLVPGLSGIMKLNAFTCSSRS